MNIKDKNILVLGGGGMVGMATCRELLAYEPGRIVVAARRHFKARQATETLQVEFPRLASRIRPAWGDIFMRAKGQEGDAADRSEVLADQAMRRRLIADVLEPLNDEIVDSSLLTQMILGIVPDDKSTSMHIVIDCMNTATAVGYQNIYSLATRLFDLVDKENSNTDWPTELETLLAALSVPQLVRHVQILYEAMRRAGTEAYVKVGTSGTGGMGFNIPYTHGEEKPSRLLLSKASLAGAQSLLTFLMARTPDAPATVREVKPAAAVGWREISVGPIITRGGRELPLYDCLPNDAVPIEDATNLVTEGAFGTKTGKRLEGVYIDTGENGVFSADEFATITSLGQMQLVTPEDVARNVTKELLGGTTGRDVIAALDSSVTGPSYRGGLLRQSALSRLRELEAEHGKSVAFEILGPPRLSKLLFEAHLVQSVAGGAKKVINANVDELAAQLAERIAVDNPLRQHIISIGIPILLPDGKRLLRGPVIKADCPHHGWVDLTPANISIWQERFTAFEGAMADDLGSGSSSSRLSRQAAIMKRADGVEEFDIGEMAGWIFIHEDAGERIKD